LPTGKNPRLIAVTGYGQPDDIRRSTDAGIDIHLVKPVEPDDLFRIIHGSVNGNNGRPPMPSAERRTGRGFRQKLADFGLATATLPGRLFRWWAYGRRIEAKTAATKRHVSHVEAHCRSLRGPCADGRFTSLSGA
jgi:CheY-like chemotaxis protein